MKIVIFGGSGFVGQGLVKRLSQEDLVIISRQSPQQANWLQSDLAKDTIWQESVQGADWVIDCIGILLPDKRRGQTYESASLEPAHRIIQFLATIPLAERPKFLFVSAKKVPWFLRGYWEAKLRVEAEMAQQIPETSLAVFPPLLYDGSRPSTMLQAAFLKILPAYRPLSRRAFCQEIFLILHGEKSYLTLRDY